MGGIIDNLNPRQREAVEYCEGPQVVLAGAGSGKTKVLTTKIAYLVREMGVKPWRILALTFTNKEAREMKSRAEAMFDGELGGLEISTFHAYGLRFLHRYHEAMEALGYPYPFVIFDRNDTRSVVKRAMNELNIDEKKLSPADALDMISGAKTKANPVTREPKIPDRWRTLYDTYQNALKAQGALDFDDLMVLPLHILATDKEVLGRERARLDWVLVDEYQDVNMPQYLLLRCLVEGGRKIMVVGDPDQSIYGWRGAEMAMILNFERDFKGSKVTVLDQNYRSTGNILDGANGVIRNNDDRHPKDLWTASDRGRKIQVRRFLKDSDEAEWIAKNIEALHDEGYNYGEIAILYRMNVLSRGMEQALLERSIPYNIIRGVAFYERAEVKDALSMLRLAVNPLDMVSLARAANIPARGIGKTTVERLGEALSKIVHENAEELWREVEKSGAGLKGKQAAGAKALAFDMLSILANKDDVGEALRAILYTNGYENYLRGEYHDDWEERVGRISRRLGGARRKRHGNPLRRHSGQRDSRGSDGDSADDRPGFRRGDSRRREYAYAARGEGARVPRRLPHRARGGNFPERARRRGRGRFIRGAPPLLRRHDARAGAALHELLGEPPALRRNTEKSAVALHQRDSR